MSNLFKIIEKKMDKLYEQQENCAACREVFFECYGCSKSDNCKIFQSYLALKRFFNEHQENPENWVFLGAHYVWASEGSCFLYYNKVTGAYMYGWELPHPYTEEYFQHSYASYEVWEKPKEAYDSSGHPIGYE